MPEANAVEVVWEDVKVRHGGYDMQRCKIHGGWLLKSSNGTVCFVPDPNHEWK